MQEVLCIAFNPALDLCTTTPRIYPIEKLRCTTPGCEPGGGAVNVARVLHRFGVLVHLILPLGGVVGQQIRQMLSRESFSFSHLEITESSRENFSVTETISGEQYRFVTPGPALSETEWHQLLAMAEETKQVPFVIVSGSFPSNIPINMVTDIAELAARLKAKLVLDTTGPVLKAALSSKPWLIKPNLEEFEQLIGRSCPNRTTLLACAKELRDEFSIEHLLISLGAQGAMLLTKAEALFLSAPKIQPVSAIGAGDSMTAAFVAASLKGASSADALRHGVAAGAAALLTPGTALCHLDTFDKILSKLLRSEVLAC